MATPHVAGLAALLFEAKPAATIDEVQDAIVASCQNLAAEPQSRIGAGIPDGLKAIAAL
jgi:subtilisin family serine protease